MYLGTYLSAAYSSSNNDEALVGSRSLKKYLKSAILLLQREKITSPTYQITIS